MSLGMSDAYKRINESHYPGRVRETALSQERADDQRHLAELEEFVKKHKGQHPQKDDKEDPEEKNPPHPPTDTLELHDGEQDAPHPASPADRAEAPPPTAKKTDGESHLDITI